MALSVETLALAKKFTTESLLGGGAVKGKNAVVKSIVKVEGGNEVTFQWTLDDGTVKTDVMFVADGAIGLNLKKVILAAAGWSGGVQTVAVGGVLADESEQLILPVPVAASEAAYAAAKIRAKVAADDTMAFTAETAPAQDIELYVAVF